MPIPTLAPVERPPESEPESNDGFVDPGSDEAVGSSFGAAVDEIPFEEAVDSNSVEVAVDTSELEVLDVNGSYEKLKTRSYV
jgi:hypothetical protein